MKLLRDYTVNDELIEQLRTKIYEYATTHQDVDLDDVRNRITSPEDMNNNNIDVNNNKTRDWMLKRWLVVSHRNLDAAFEKFLEFFRFRHQFQVSKLTAENSLPRELFQVRAMEKGGLDKQQNQTLIIRLKTYKKIQQLDLVVKRALLYFFEQFDLEYESKQIDGICLIIDAYDFGITNLDLDLLHFVVKQVPFNYSGLVRSVLVYELPFLLSYLVKIVESWLPTYTDKSGNKQKYFAVIGKKNIDEFVDEDQRPDNLNGTFIPTTANSIPNDIVPFGELAKTLQIKEANVAKINQHIEHLLKEIDDK